MKIISRIYIQQILVVFALLSLCFYSINHLHESQDFSQISAENLLNCLFYIVIYSAYIAVSLTLISRYTLSSLRRAVDVVSDSIQTVSIAAERSGDAINAVSRGAKLQSYSIDHAVAIADQSIVELRQFEEVAKIAIHQTEQSENIMIQTQEKLKMLLSLLVRIDKNCQILADQRNSIGVESTLLIKQITMDTRSSKLVILNFSPQVESHQISSKATVGIPKKMADLLSNQMETNESLSQNLNVLRDIGSNNVIASEEVTVAIFNLISTTTEMKNAMGKSNI